ncbi:MAG: HAMP domain-containing protein [Alphaproteobacteria bacterium]|nr:HAMP domain-containing protein [Alphaproteobacteria bacterium]
MLPARLLRTSSFRLTLAYAGLFGASVLILFGVIYWATDMYITRSLDAAIDSDFVELGNTVNAGGRALLARQIHERLRQMPRGAMHYLLEDQDGNVIAGDLPRFAKSTGRYDLNVHEADSRSRHQRGIRARGAALSGGDYLMVGIDAHPRDEMHELILRAFGWGSGITLVLAFGGGALLSSSLLRRVETISRAAREIMSGDFAQRIPVREADDEFDHLVTSLNAMLDRIQSSMESVRQVSDDIAHDLRTPLTRLRQRLEQGQRARSPEEWHSAAAGCIAEMDAILETFGALLRIAQIESGAAVRHFGEVDLSDVLRTMAEVYEPMADEKGQSFTAQISCGLTVWGDRELVGQMLANIIENAMKHSPPGARIGLETTVCPTEINVAVTDSGPGIPADEHRNVFSRFYRLESSRSTPGSGLGLSLVEAIARLHRVRIDLADNDPGLHLNLRFAPVGAAEIAGCTLADRAQGT